MKWSLVYSHQPTLRSIVMITVAKLKFMRRTDKLSAKDVTFVGDKCFWRHKNNSVTVLPLDGSYRQLINPSWNE